MTDSSTSVQPRAVDLDDRVGGVLDADRPELAQRAARDVEQRDAHDRVVGDQQRRHVDAQASRESAPNARRRRAAIRPLRTSTSAGTFAPGRVARRIVGGDLVAQRPSQVPWAISISASSVSSVHVQPFGDEDRGRARALHRARDDARRRRRCSRERAGEREALLDAARRQRRFAPALVAAGQVPRRLGVAGDVQFHVVRARARAPNGRRERRAARRASRRRPAGRCRAP